MYQVLLYYTSGFGSATVTVNKPLLDILPAISFNDENIYLAITFQIRLLCRYSTPLCEMCPNTDFFLVCIFPHSDWIRRDTKIRTEYGEIRIQSECGKIRTRKNSVLGHFSRSVQVLPCKWNRKNSTFWFNLKRKILNVPTKWLNCF